MASVELRVRRRALPGIRRATVAPAARRVFGWIALCGLLALSWLAPALARSADAAPVRPTAAGQTSAGPTSAGPTSASPTGPATGGVRLTTGDLVVPGDYWSDGGAVAELAMTVRNTGPVAQRIRLTYELPGGLRDTEAGGCVAVRPFTFRCPARHLAAGAEAAFRARIRVTADAWRRMPLTGTVSVAAAPVDTDEPAATNTARTFAVLFPPGPPTSGIDLSAPVVRLAPGTPARGELDIELTNTGDSAGTAVVRTVLPAGLTVSTPPAGCVSAGRAQLRCALGNVPAGASGRLRLPLAATADATAGLPLAGAVFATVTALSGPARQAGTSFRVLLSARADAALRQAPDRPLPDRSSAAPVDPIPTPGAVAVSPGWTDRLDARLVAALVAGVGVLALLLATISLRRPLREKPLRRGPADRSTATGME